MTGDFEEACALLERAVVIYENALGRDHARVAQQLTALAIVYPDAGDGPSAEPLLVRALSIQEKAQDDPNYLATTSHHLACVRRDAGDHYSARALFQRAIEIRETQLGPDHPWVADSLDECATLLRLTGEVTEAEELEARARAIREKPERGSTG
jgi:tetratricopeptide (TPR) repeat protein